MRGNSIVMGYFNYFVFVNKISKYLLNSVEMQVQFLGSVSVWTGHSSPSAPPGELPCSVLPGLAHLQSGREKTLFDQTRLSTCMATHACTLFELCIT